MILVMPGGAAHTFPVSHDIHTFEPFPADIGDPNSLWLVDIPPEFAHHFLHNAGFSMYDDQTASPPTGEIPMVRLRNAAGTGCGWNGIAYEPDAYGVVEVPAAAAVELKWHGFELAPAVEAPAEVAEVSRSASESEDENPGRRNRRGYPMAVGDLANFDQAARWITVTFSDTIKDDDQQTVLDLITSASDFLKKWLGRDIVSTDYEDIRDGPGGRQLVFAAYPVTAVDLVMVDEVSIPLAASSIASGYSWTDTRIVLRGQFLFWRGLSNVVLHYTAGFDESNIPPAISQACVEFVAQRWRERARIGIKQENIVGVDSHTYNVSDLQPATRTAVNLYRTVAPVAAYLRRL
jgi:hypothetical protein